MNDNESIIIEQRQEIKRGADATQIGTQNNTYGLSYRDTKELCTDLIKAELNIYKQEAEEVAKLRDTNLLQNFLERLSKEKIEDKEIAEEFKNPDMQFSYIEAQKSYIRLGTKELEDTLAQLLVDRLKEKDRTLLQIALGEAITVVPILLPEQLDILALCFRLRYTQKLDVNNLMTFYNYLKVFILPHISGEQKKLSLYQHLVYAKTGSIDIGEISLEELFSRTYPGLFMKGFDITEIESYISKYPSFFTRCQQNPSKMQINALNSDVLTSKLTEIIIDQNDKNDIQRLYDQNKMSISEIKDAICSALPPCNNLFDLWNNSQLKHFTLTSIGIVLGANRSKQICGESFNMNIWI